MAAPPLIDGRVQHGFEPVREAFVENFTRRGELGAACCVYRDGEKVVDLWGGVRDRRERRAVARRHDGDRPLHHQGPRRDGHGAGPLPRAGSTTTSSSAPTGPSSPRPARSAITVRQLLAHQAGLFAFDEKVDRDVVADLDRLAEVMARQRPAWAPGRAPGVPRHQPRLLRGRADPAHRSGASQPRPGLPRGDRRAARSRLLHRRARDDPRRAHRAARAAEPLEAADRHAVPARPSPRMNRRSVLHRSLVANPGTGFYLDPERVVVREPGGPVGRRRRHRARRSPRRTACSPPAARELGLRAETIEALKAPAIPSRHGFYDECFRGPAKFSLGFMKPSETFPFGHPGAFGAPGAGGSMGYADPRGRASATATSPTGWAPTSRAIHATSHSAPRCPHGPAGREGRARVAGGGRGEHRPMKWPRGRDRVGHPGGP